MFVPVLPCVRTSQLIGGATEDTIIARVGGQYQFHRPAETHFDVLENPDMITRVVLSRGWMPTAFEIVSIDIADIDVGENIGARLQSDQAEADTELPAPGRT